jgi:DNA invertase Pin-like site-specific DNA recombinase
VPKLRLGYARVSTGEQNLDLQINALSAHGVDLLFTDRISGSRWHRPGLTSLLEKAAAGDQIIVWKLDRLGRSTLQILTLISFLKEKEIKLLSLTEGLDSETPVGQFTITILAGIAQWERDLIRERTLSGLAAAAARGRKGGRRRKLNQDQRDQLKELLPRTDLTKKEKASRLGISISTYYREARQIAQPNICGIPLEDF